MTLMESENEAIRRLLVPILKEKYFVKTSVRVDRLHAKLKTEGFLSSEELNIKHPFHPDIDVLYWSKEYSGEPNIYASEVKYFRLKEGVVYPNIYEGLGEALMLLTYGTDFVSLWHLFDPEIPPETVSRYRDLTQNLVSDTYSPINYQSWLLPEIPTKSNDLLPTKIPTKPTPEDTKKLLMKLFKNMEVTAFTLSLTQSLKTNPIKNRWDSKIMRSLIKKSFRIVSK